TVPRQEKGLLCPVSRERPPRTVADRIQGVQGLAPLSTVPDVQEAPQETGFRRGRLHATKPGALPPARRQRSSSALSSRKRRQLGAHPDPKSRRAHALTRSYSALRRAAISARRAAFSASWSLIAALLCPSTGGWPAKASGADAGGRDSGGGAG